MTDSTAAPSVTDGLEAPTRIVGIGNLLVGDDGLGPRAMEVLIESGLPPGVSVIDGGTGGLDILDLIEGAERVIFVDAVSFGGQPGDIRAFTPDEVRRLDGGRLASLHGIGLLDALDMARAIGLALPATIQLVGVQPKTVATGEGLSPEIEARLPDVVRTVQDLLAMNPMEGDTTDG